VLPTPDFPLERVPFSQDLAGICEHPLHASAPCGGKAASRCPTPAGS
jgi:hypothetical protein